MTRPQAYDSDIVIVGAGWAGLAAASRLSLCGKTVTLIEAAPEPGGRARDIRIGEQTLDNGQHILLGAYHQTLSLLEQLGVPEQDCFCRVPLRLEFISTDAKQRVCIKTARLPAPWHLLSALLGASGVSWRDKWSMIRFWRRLQQQSFTIEPDQPVLDYLQTNAQSENLIHFFWEPLCLAALNTPISVASTKVFLKVLQQSFNARRNDSDFLFPLGTLGQVLPQAARQVLEQRGSRLVTGERVTELMHDNGLIKGVRTAKHHYPVSQLVLATPFRETLRLLQPIEPYSHVTAALEQLHQQPITTLYLQLPGNMQLDYPIVGIDGKWVQWLIDRRHCGQAGLFGAVISAEGPHMSMDKPALTRVILDEIASVFPHWPAPTKTWLTREKQATFACTVDAQQYRPDMRPLQTNLYLAGDYVASALPATLETAIGSGLQCADLIQPS